MNITYSSVFITPATKIRLQKILTSLIYPQCTLFIVRPWEACPKSQLSKATVIHILPLLFNSYLQCHVLIAVTVG